MMVNKFSHEGQRRGSLLTWAQSITDEAFSIDPVFMEGAAMRVFGNTVWCWTGAETTEAKIHAICRAALIVRLQAGSA